LLINLVSAHITRFTLNRKKIGLWLVHFGLILLLLGQLMTDMLSRESTLHLREGETKNYSEVEREAELAVIDTTDQESDKVVAIPQHVLMRQKQIQHGELPFMVRVKDYFANSQVENRAADAVEPAAATQGIGARATVRELPRVTVMDKRDAPSAVVELVGPNGSLGSWLVSEFIEKGQPITVNNRNYEVVLRPRRDYKPYSIQLLNFTHDIYKGTDIPKNYSSRVRLQRPDTGEAREVLIYMNNPLRYAGETYYQASFDEDDKGSILQVVHNPSWLTPYFSCVMVGAGLVVQFLIHLVPFLKRRITA
jgi:cytochrome c biogenesis protein ResB